MHISSSEAIEYYGNKRSVDVSRSVETVRSPSQQMMLDIFQQSLGMDFIPSVSRVLNGIIISSSIIGIDSLNPVVAVYQQHSLVHCSVPKKGRNADVGEAPAVHWPLSVTVVAVVFDNKCNIALNLTFAHKSCVCIH